MFLSACASEDQKEDLTDGGFDALYRAVIEPRCAARCHQQVADPPAGQHDLVMSEEGAAFAALVAVPSARCEEQMLRVVPGDPEASLLWRKVAPGEPVCGFKMPPDCFTDECGLSQDEADLVYDWIAAGAVP